MKVRDLVPYIDKEDSFVLMDMNDQHTTVEPHMMSLTLRDIMGCDVIKIGRFRYDRYCEEDYLMVKVAYNKEEV